MSFPYPNNFHRGPLSNNLWDLDPIRLYRADNNRAGKEGVISTTPVISVSSLKTYGIIIDALILAIVPTIFTICTGTTFCADYSRRGRRDLDDGR